MWHMSISYRPNYTSGIRKQLCTFLLNTAEKSNGINLIPNISYSSPIAPNVTLTPVVPEPEKSTENE